MGSILAFLVVVVSFFFGAELWAIAGAPIEPTNRNISDKSVVFIVYIVKCNKSVYTITKVSDLIPNGLKAQQAHSPGQAKRHPGSKHIR